MSGPGPNDPERLSRTKWFDQTFVVLKENSVVQKGSDLRETDKDSYTRRQGYGVQESTVIDKSRVRGVEERFVFRNVGWSFVEILLIKVLSNFIGLSFILFCTYRP